MNKIIFFILTIISISICANPNGKNIHTSTYNDWINGRFNHNFFIEETFGNNIVTHKEDLCKTLSRNEYINLLKNNDIYCTGDWCDKNGLFTCTSYPCYQREHIIDQKHSLFDYNPDSKDILGNYIMAYSKWNQQIGQLKWENVEKEKRIIYGDDIVNKAIENIAYCQELLYSQKSDYTLYGDYTSNLYNNSQIDNNKIHSLFLYFIILLSIFLPIIIIIIYVNRKEIENKLIKNYVGV